MTTATISPKPVKLRMRYTNTMMSDSNVHISFKPDEKKHTTVAYTYADTTNKYHFAYIMPNPQILIRKGQWKKDSIHIRLHKLDLDNFLLIKRGFHWVNKFPFNR